MLEFFFCFVVLSGVIKASLSLLGINFIDLTLLSILLYTSYFVKNLLFSKIILTREKLYFLVFILAFYCINMVSVLSSSFVELSTKKFIFSLIPLYISVTFLTFNKFDFNKFCRIFVYFSIATSFIFLLFSIQYRLGLLDKGVDAERIKTLYLTIGGVIAIAIIMLLTHSEKFIKYKLPISGFLLLVLFVSAARGPLLFLILCLLLFFLKSIPNIISYLKLHSLTPRSLSKALIVTFMGASLLFLATKLNILGISQVSDILGGSLDRIMQLFSDDKGSSIGYRVEMFHKTIGAIDGHYLFGIGYGNFGPLVISEYKYYYPHNMLLEVWVETGLIGLLSVLVLFIYPFLLAHKNFCIQLIVLFLVFNALKSYSLAENRILFSFLTMLVSIKAITQNKEVK